jgi:hypothetical protein
MKHRGRHVTEHPVDSLALVAHRSEQGVPHLEPRRRARGRHVGAPADPDQLAGPPLPAQIVVAPTSGE